MVFSNKIQCRFAGFEKNLNLPAFSINTDNLFFGKGSICADKSKSVLPISFVPYANNLCRNWILLSYHNTDRKQIL